MRTVQIISLLLASLVAGCAQSNYKPGPRNFDRGLEALASNDYDAAYRFLEHPSPGTEADVLVLMQQNPKLVDAAKGTFSSSALSDSITLYGRSQAFQIEYSRLQRFAVYADPTDFRTAADVFTASFPIEIASYHEREAERARVAKLPDAEQQKYWAESFRRSVEAATVRGNIVNSQLVDLSRPGTSAGTNIGAIAAQAIYIDSVSWKNYRATAQLGAGLLGALVGNSVDQRPVTMYQKVYFVRTKNGDVKRIDEKSSDPVLIPTGICIEYREPFHLSIAPDGTCLQ